MVNSFRLGYQISLLSQIVRNCIQQAVSNILLSVRIFLKRKKKNKWICKKSRISSKIEQYLFKTRKHSNRMRTARLLTVSQHALCRKSVYPSMHWAGVCLGVWQTPHRDHRQTPPPGTTGRPPREWQTGVKTLPCRNFGAGGKNKRRLVDFLNWNQGSKGQLPVSWNKSLAGLPKLLTIPSGGALLYCDPAVSFTSRSTFRRSPFSAKSTNSPKLYLWDIYHDYNE